MEPLTVTQNHDPTTVEHQTGAFSDLGSREHTRLVSIYSLTNRLPQFRNQAKALSSLLVFGRFGRHVAASDSILPRVIHSDAKGDITIRVGGDDLAVRVRQARALMAITPRSDAVLIFDMEIESTASCNQMAETLAQTCFRRDELIVGETPILQWVEDMLLPNLPPQQHLSFGLDVHQIVFPGSSLHDEILAGDPDHSISKLVFRGTISGTGMLRKPAALNYGDRTFAAHGRGVSILGGWAAPVENIITAVATTMVSTLGVLQRAKRSAFQALTRNENAMLQSPSDARKLITELAEQLMIMQLDLSFGVEAYLDSVLVPELIVESFQTSLCDSLGTTEALTNTSRMLERLQSVIGARRAELENAVQGRGEHRGKILSGVGLIGSILALPPALLLAFFGVNAKNVDDNRSILEIDHYWKAYVAAWAPFVVLALIGWLMLRTTGQPAKATPISQAHTTVDADLT